MANPLYPTVPNADGVPPVLSFAANLATSVAAIVLADTLEDYLVALSGPWGIYDSSGNQVVVADTVGSVEFGRDYTIATAPQEQGSFQSYNKVSNPFTVRLLLFCGGTAAARTAFFAALDAATASTTLYSVLTPEVAYPSVNVLGYRYARRQDRGASLIGAEVSIQEVRVTAATQLSNTPQAGATAQPDGSPTQSQGSVQTGTISDAGIPTPSGTEFA